MSVIPYGRQSITLEDIDCVVEILKSDFLTQGPKVLEFEKNFADYVEAKYAVAVSNGTAALHLCAMALDIKEGDKVITTPITFVASANGFRYCGAEITFCDIDPQSYLLDLDKLEDLLKKHPKGYYKAIIPVDFAGYPIHAEKLKQLAKTYGCRIVEDACHAPGAYFKDSEGKIQRSGNGNFSDLTVFSFHPVKHIATGEGGMISTNNEDLYKKLCLYRTHGITKDHELLEENHGGWYYEMHELGYNYRLSDIQAALGVSQLKKAEKNITIRNAIAQKYDKAFANHSKIKTPHRDDNIEHAFHLYIIQIENRKGLFDYLRVHNIFSQVLYIPAHYMPYYKKQGWKKGDFPIAEAYYEKCLALPMFPTLRDEEQEYVIEKVLEFLG
ncbi:MAG: UDP-4-amino-4,6-dideoxy-N-acetyl-beta-L-altrosamine transaminase [Marinifilaceae bacterium]|jgi:UDP-4-amino-4,6-dideoxy-N-acetyl-beta-L-altrosamine transaminase|nr:UDP-4-amino-4,6-dideoxy-N-acetyl-beta-L-altrosamine transaminase [Marinifilaceae bacterium]